MDTRTATDSKVCRNCSTLAPADQEHCTSCNETNWAPIPRELAYSVDPEAVKQHDRPVKLPGYRGFVFPPLPSHAQVGDEPSLPGKDPEFAAMLASLTGVIGLWGVGHIYVGKRATGILLLLAGASAWGTYLGLNEIGRGPLFWVFGAVVWGFLLAWAYSEIKASGLGGRTRWLPGLAITSTVVGAAWKVDIAYIFIALALTSWIYLTSRAYNLAVEYNDHRDKHGSSPW